MILDNFNFFISGPEIELQGDKSMNLFIQSCSIIPSFGRDYDYHLFAFFRAFMYENWLDVQICQNSMVKNYTSYHKYITSLASFECNTIKMMTDT